MIEQVREQQRKELNERAATRGMVGRGGFAGGRGGGGFRGGRGEGIEGDVVEGAVDEVGTEEGRGDGEEQGGGNCYHVHMVM